LKFVDYWFFNFGVSLFILPIGLIFAPILVKKVFLSVLPIFIIGHTIQFSPEVAGNHKFFSIFIIFLDMLVAFILVKLWNLHLLTKIVTTILLVMLTLSGIIDFFAIKNDNKIKLSDYPINQDIRWIIHHTPKDATFLNTTYIYNPASLAGRFIFLGWPYFAWSEGYQGNRMEQMKFIYEKKDPSAFCPVLLKEHISYMTVEDTKGDPNLPVIDVDYFLKNFKPEYVDPKTPYAIFAVTSLCP
jgi:hypothetical protein